MQQFGPMPTKADPCVYTIKDGKLCLALYVDDGLVMGKTKYRIDKLLKSIRKEFEAASLVVSCYLGTKIFRDHK